MKQMSPREIVEELDRYIIGQQGAKKAVAIALRNRHRRKLVSGEISEDIYPRNIIMIGPTGVGKTEIARRLAKMVNAPFIKVEASKFTEVGYVGRDVDSMIRDLTETAVRMVKQEKMEEVQDKAEQLAEERILNYILPPLRKKSRSNRNPLEVLLGTAQEPAADSEHEARAAEIERKREILAQKLKRMELEQEIVEIEVEERSTSFMEIFSGSGVEEMGVNMQEMMGNLMPKGTRKSKVTVEEARKILAFEEAQRLVDMDVVKREAIHRVENDGMVFLDEIDKIAGKDSSNGPDVSRGGVQRDILPIIEGSTVVTKYGPVNTAHILFIAAGAFHVSKPSDLIPELQGRFPIRVELDSLNREDLKRILTEPHHSLIKQYVALLATEGLQLDFEEDAVDCIAEIAYEVNARTENIGARRLHTIMEKVLEDLLFETAHAGAAGMRIDRSYVEERLQKIVKDDDLSRYIL
ncbi:MAG: ATP-dependent protease ATPase subunit HslU [Syntrophomonadaceae bacterium]|nr:ATP-dependent protease ATPase subunit HslU [Syntrophomonadaceae bacterium]